MHARALPQRFELVEVADLRKRDHGHLNACARAGGPVVEHAVFFGQPVATPHRQDRERGHAGELLQLLRAGRKQRCVATKTVQHKTADQRAFFRQQQLVRAEQVGERTATVDVGHEQASGLGVQGGAHVDVVARVQVDLGRRARAFDHDDLVVAHQRVEPVACERPQALAAFAPGHGGQVGAHAAHHDHLAGGVVLGLEQHRVHAHLGRGARRQRLKVLRAADLAHRAVDARHDTRVVAHVLRLERRDLQTLPRVPAAQCCCEPALAGAAGRAQHHHGARRHGPFARATVASIASTTAAQAACVAKRSACKTWSAPGDGADALSA